MIGGKAGVFVTWQEAEDALMAAFEYLSGMPDRDRAFLAAGTRSAWPEIVRESWEYADAEASPSVRLSRRNAEHVDRFLTGPAPLANVIAEQHRAFVGRVVSMQLWPGPDGFGWDRVFRMQRGVLFNLVRKAELPTTSDGMRKAYERAVGKVAVAMTTRVELVQSVVRQG